MGRPSKFDQSVRDRIMMLAAKGATDKDMAEAIGVHEATFNLWKHKHPDFYESLRSAKDIADDMVESALLNNAINNNNVTAQIFWLKNRRTKEWRDKVEVALEAIEEMEF